MQCSDKSVARERVDWSRAELSVCQRRFHKRTFTRTKDSTFLYVQNSKALNVNILHPFKLEQSIGHSTNFVHEHTHTPPYLKLCWVYFSKFYFFPSTPRLCYPKCCIVRKHSSPCTEWENKFTILFFQPAIESYLFFVGSSFICPKSGEHFTNRMNIFICNLWFLTKKKTKYKLK